VVGRGEQAKPIPRLHLPWGLPALLAPKLGGGLGLGI
jgi:hypothetical protein